MLFNDEHVLLRVRVFINNLLLNLLETFLDQVTLLASHVYIYWSKFLVLKKLRENKLT
jgi:hypothetical protein